MMTLPQQTTTQVQQSNMLVQLTISRWTATKHDKQISKEVAYNHNSDESLGRYNKCLVAKGALDQINLVAGQARQAHYLVTLPYDDSGTRVLSGKAFFDYREKMQEFKYKFNAAVDEFVRVYPALVDEARVKLGSLFREEDYPPAYKIRSKFGFEISFDAMPSSDHFTVALGASIEDEIRREQAERYNSRLEKAQKDVFVRMKEVVQHMSDRLKIFVKLDNGKTANNFHASMVDNIRELVDLIPLINVTDNQDINEFARKMRDELCYYSPESLRLSETAREKTAQAANEILDKLNSYF